MSEHSADNMDPLTIPQSQQQSQQQQQQQVFGHIRGFHTDMENRPGFVLNYDTTTTDEQQRRRDRLSRFGGEAANDDIAQLDLIDGERKKAQSRLDRFTSNTDSMSSSSYPLDHELSNAMGIDLNSQHPGYNYPEIMPFEALNHIPQEQVEYEMSGFNPTAPRRWDTLHLFGTRLLLQGVRTEDLLQRYREDGLLRVEWQSDYRCNLVFVDSFSAKRVLDQETYVKDLDVVAAKKHFPIKSPNQTEEQNNSSFDEQALPFMVWRQSIYSEDDNTAKGSLVMRLATQSDIKEPLEIRKHSRFYLDNYSYFTQILRHRRAKAVDERQLEQEEGKSGITIVPLDPSKVPQLPQRKVITTSAANRTATTAQQNQQPQTRPVEKPPGAKGRGFESGRAGTFNIPKGAHTIVKNNAREERYGNNNMGDDNDNDITSGNRRQRDRVYSARPVVNESTTLMTTVLHNQTRVEQRQEMIEERLQKQAEADLRRQNNPMARILIDKSTVPVVPKPTADRIYQPPMDSEVPPDLPAPDSGFAAMYGAVIAQEEAEAQEKLRIREEQRLERERIENERQAQLELERQEQERREQLVFEENQRLQAEQNAILAQQAQAEAAMMMGGNHNGDDNNMNHDDDYAE